MNDKTFMVVRFFLFFLFILISNLGVSAGRVELNSGQDTTVAGARVEGSEVALNTGGNLTVESRQDTTTGKSSQKGMNLSLSMGLGGAPLRNQNGTFNSNLLSDTMASTSNTFKGLDNKGNSVGFGGDKQKTLGLGLTYGKGSTDKAWTEEQTVIVAANSLDLNVKGNTHLKGSVLKSDSGDLDLNTATLTYENLADYDKSKNFNVSVNLSYSFGGPEKQTDANGKETQESIENRAKLGDVFRKNPVKVEGSYERSEKQQVTRATIGKGDLNIRDKDAQKATGQDVASINRDVENTQEVTKDEEKGVKFYVSDTAVKTTAKVIKKAVEYIDELVKTGKITSEEAKQRKKVADAMLEKEIDGESWRACDKGGEAGRQGWLHNLLFTPAYADAAGDGCFIRFKGADALYRNGVRIPEAEYNAIRKELSDKYQGYAVATAQEINRLGDSDPQRTAYLKEVLVGYAAYFALCSDNPDALNSILPSSQFYNSNAIYQTAMTYRKGGAELATAFKSFSDPQLKKVAELRAKNPGLYNALVYGQYVTTGNLDFQDGQKTVDALFLLTGVSASSDMSLEDRQRNLKMAVSVLPKSGYSLSTLMSTHSQTLYMAEKALSPEDRAYFQKELQQAVPGYDPRTYQRHELVEQVYSSIGNRSKEQVGELLKGLGAEIDALDQAVDGKGLYSLDRATKGLPDTRVILVKAFENVLVHGLSENPEVVQDFIINNQDFVHRLQEEAATDARLKNFIFLTQVGIIAGPYVGPALLQTVRGIAANCSMGAQACAAELTILAEDIIASFPELGGTGVGSTVAAKGLSKVTASSLDEAIEGVLRKYGDDGVTDFVFRGDTRSHELIFNEGFEPYGKSSDLYMHAWDNTFPPSVFVPTSRSFDVAAKFADNVYVVRPQNGIDVNKALGSESPFPHEFEIAIPYGVNNFDIRAVTIVDNGISILNPNFKK